MKQRISDARNYTRVYEKVTLADFRKLVRSVEGDFALWSTITRLIPCTHNYNITGSFIRKNYINPHDVFACCWNMKRLDSIERIPPKKYRQFLKKFPPKVIGYETVLGKNVYVVIDGNHRIVRARSLKLRRVPAEVYGVIRPLHRVFNEAIIDDTGVWLRTKKGYVFKTRLEIDEYTYIHEIITLFNLRGIVVVTNLV